MANALYQHMVSHTADAEPQWGGWNWTDLPELSATDIQLICATKPGDVMEELREGELTELLVLDQATGKNGAVRLPAAIEQACRKVLFRDIEVECERRYEERETYREELEHFRMTGRRAGAH